MTNVFIYHHLGLGDHIIANGMVRTIAKKYDNVYLFCKPRNFSNVSFMYRDLQHLKIIQMDDIDVKNFMSFNHNNNYVIAGHDKFWKILYTPGNTLKIDEIIYQLADVPLENKWTEFFVLRDIEKEKMVFKQLEVNEGEEYAFVHDDDIRQITKELPKIKIIRPLKHFSLFDFIYTIEKAKEIHCINSSFFCLIDCMNIQNNNMFFHYYVRPDREKFQIPILKSNWKIIE
jgi:hypothetical protein